MNPMSLEIKMTTKLLSALAAAAALLAAPRTALAQDKPAEPPGAARGEGSPSPSPQKPKSEPAPALTWKSGDSAVTLYGTLNVNFENVRAGGIVSSRNRVNSNRSNFGIKGQTKAGIFVPWFQVESEVGLDVGGTTLAGRNSGIGTAVGPYGTLMFGQWDSPYKVSTARLDPFGDKTIGGYSAIMGGGGLTTAGNGGGLKGSFARRVQNVAQYWSPNVAGFSGRAAYGSDKEKAADRSYDPQLWSFSLTYEGYGLYALAAYEDHKDFGFLYPNQGHDQAWKVGGGYALTDLGVSVAGILEQISYSLSTPDWARKNLDLFLAATYRVDVHSVSLSWSHKFNDSISGVSIADTNADLMGARYGYAASRQFEIYALAVRLHNASRSAKDFSTNPLAGVPQGPSGNPPITPAGAPTPAVKASDFADQSLFGFGGGFEYKF